MTFPRDHYTFSPRLEEQMYGRRRVRRAVGYVLGALGALAILVTLLAGCAFYGAVAALWWG